jgi:hydroxymethylpyrimidine/phosphomethylpyrimidine kinase
VPLVVDPVMIAKGGAALLDPGALEALSTRLIARATLVTPNLPEAALLSGIAIASLADGGAPPTRFWRAARAPC